jgi:hypothetical protein
MAKQPDQPAILVILAEQRQQARLSLAARDHPRQRVFGDEIAHVGGLELVNSSVILHPRSGRAGVSVHRVGR